MIKQSGGRAQSTKSFIDTIKSKIYTKKNQQKEKKSFPELFDFYLEIFEKSIN